MIFAGPILMEEILNNNSSLSYRSLRPQPKSLSSIKYKNIMSVISMTGNASCQNVDELVAHPVDSSLPKTDSDNKNSPDVELIYKLFMDMFTRSRYSGDQVRMEEVRRKLVQVMQSYSLETYTQRFKCSVDGVNFEGANILGILPGKNRNVEGKDKVLVLGAHYDTVPASPGVEDNGSGVIANLEVARILSSRSSKLEHTIIFVAFDQEETGLFGSRAFVRNYLIPQELTQRKTGYLGAYVSDMLLNYSPDENSQKLPGDFEGIFKDQLAEIRKEGSRGDFLCLWGRDPYDKKLSEKLANVYNSSPEYKVRQLITEYPEFSSGPGFQKIEATSTFTTSDHASFWYHNDPVYNKTLPCILLNDMGPWRGDNGHACYHTYCDSTYLKDKNVHFMAKTIDALVAVSSESFE